MSTQTEMKKPKGNKDYKKAQKEKAAAKRIAAAEKAKQLKVAKVEKKAEVAKVEENVGETSAQHDISSPVKVIAADESVGDAVALAGAVDVRDDNSAVQESATAVDTMLNRGTPVLTSAKEVPMVDGHDSFGAEYFKETVVAEHDVFSCNMSPEICSTVDTHIHANDQVIGDQTSDTNGQVPITDSTPSVDTFDIHAHRKALEAALYDNMESPMERLARLAPITTADAEFNGVLYERDVSVAEYIPEDDSMTIKRAVDDNGFGMLATHTDTPDDAVIARSMSIDDLFSKVSDSGASVAGHSNAQVSRTLADVESQQDAQYEPVDATTTPSMSVDELFAMVSSSGASVVGSSAAKTSRALVDVESQQEAVRYHPHFAGSLENDKSVSVSVVQLFAAAASEEELVVELPAAAGDEHTRRARKMMCIEAGITFGCEDELQDAQPKFDAAIVSCKISEVQALGDPAIISCKIKEQHGDPFEASAADNTPHHDAARKASMDDGSQKLKDMLGISSTASSFSSASQDGADKIMSLLGVDRPRVVSDSTIYSKAASSTGRDDRAQTPHTHYSVSPPPMSGQYGANQGGYQFDGGFEPRWAPPMMAMPYGPPHGFAPPPFVQWYNGQPLFQNFVPGQSFFQDTGLSQPYDQHADLGQPFYQEPIPEQPVYYEAAPVQQPVQNAAPDYLSFHEFVPGRLSHGAGW